ncbi:Two pore calcium channel protein 1 [Symbiodinium microadriaticum]|uniref:Two pore calcium channel protein 1 n=1 Tax=Symbiodinium microadriaticum TaxID=2951 RepID=A0A1Q9E8C4_SYMMI|nr:Two pore calcium channel protein 1 [Symbiodinium microadriaticum]
MASAAPAKHAESRVSFSTAAPDLVSEGSQDQVRSLPVISLGGGVQLASSVDLAVIWVNKAAKGSSQWVQSLPQKQLACYYFRKKLKPVTVLLKYAFLSLAIFERPSWCLGKQHCLETEGVYSWNIPQLPFQVSNSFEIVCLAYFFFMFGLRRRSLGEGAIHSRWHCARLVLLIVSLADCLVAVVNTMGIVPGSFRLCRLCRPLIFLSATKFIRNTWNRLSLSFWDFWTVLASLALCVLFFVWLGIVIFAKTKEGQNHFDSWSHSAASLWILFTTANYPDVMVDAYTSMRVSFFFFFIYLVISLYLLNNILLAAVYNAYKEQMRKQLQEFYRNKSTSIDHAFELLCEPGPEDADASSEAAIRFEKWMSFFTAYGISVLGQGSQRDGRGQGREGREAGEGSRQGGVNPWHFSHSTLHRALATKTIASVVQSYVQKVQLLDSDGSGSISREEFKIVVHALADPHIYIPMRPIPEAAGTCWGRRLRRLFQDGVKLPFVSKRIRWESVVDIVVLIEILLALAQTWIFVSPLVGGKFNDESLSPGPPD